MAHTFVMNMEIMTLNIADKLIYNMTNNNYDANGFIDEKILINNLEYGFLAIVSLNCYFESFINSLLVDMSSMEIESLLKCSIEEKMEILFALKEKSWGAVKSDNLWKEYKNIVKVRNELIHFKKSYVGMSSVIPDFKIGKESVGTFFTLSKFKDINSNCIKLANKIAELLNYTIVDNASVFECDGRSNNYKYIKKR